MTNSVCGFLRYFRRQCAGRRGLMKMITGQPGPWERILYAKCFHGMACRDRAGTPGLRGPAVLRSEFARDGGNRRGDGACPAVPPVPQFTTRGDGRRHRAHEQTVMPIRDNKELVANTPHNTLGTHKAHAEYTQGNTPANTRAETPFAAAPLPGRRSASTSYPIPESAAANRPPSRWQLHQHQQGVVTR